MQEPYHGRLRTMEKLSPSSLEVHTMGQQAYDRYRPIPGESPGLNDHRRRAASEPRVPYAHVGVLEGDERSTDEAVCDGTEVGEEQRGSGGWSSVAGGTHEDRRAARRLTERAWVGPRSGRSRPSSVLGR